MYAIVKHGGKQYKVVPNEEFVLEKIDAVKGDKVDLGKIGKVLFLNDDKNIETEAKGLEKIKVQATVIEHFQNDKVTAFKYKSKKNYRRKKGHRQLQTRVMVESIGSASTKSAGSEKKVAVNEKKETAKKETVKKADGDSK